MKLFSTSRRLMPIMLKIITRNVVEKIIFLLFMDTLPKKEVILESFSSFTSTLLFETKFKRVGRNEKVITKDVINKAKNALEKDFLPISDMRASGKYRKIIAKNLLEKCFLEINEKKIIGIYS